MPRSTSRLPDTSNSKPGTTSPTRSNTPSPQALIASLRALTRNDATLTVSQTGAEISSTADASSETIPKAVARHLIASGCVSPQKAHWKLSAAGRMTLRRLLSSPTGNTDPDAAQDAFRAQQQMRRKGIVTNSTGKAESVLINDAESPLGWLHRRKDKTGAPLISTTQFEAGERLSRDFAIARQTPRVTASWSATASSARSRRGAGEAAASLTEAALAARQRIERALRDVGPELSGVLVDVCCHMIKLSDAERENAWPQRSGKVILDLALTRLARHYGMDVRQCGSQQRQRIKAWHDPQFASDLSQWFDEKA